VSEAGASIYSASKRAREEFPEKLLLGVVLNGAPSGKLAQSKYYYGEAVSSPA